MSINGEVADGSIEKKENGSNDTSEQVLIDVDEPVSNSFSLTFLNSFNKASALSEQVNLSFSGDTPLVVEYNIGNLGKLKFYLAPKINDE